MTRILAPVLAVALAVLGVACGGSDPAAPPVSPSPLAKEQPAVPPPSPLAQAQPTAAATKAPSTPTSAPVATPTSPPAETPTPAGYNSNVAMYDIFPAFSVVKPELADTLDEVVAQNDQSLVPFLVEVLRFMPSSRSWDLIGQALRDLTGQTYASEDWDLWMDWVGQNGDRFDPPSEYAAWKAKTYSAIDPRMGYFIRPAAEFSRIDLTEVVWGGVLTDGIPDLRNPSALTPDEVDYMQPDDRVFGVHINGESKAYPLRVVNAHEMVNDTVGGEPISLMW